MAKNTKKNTKKKGGITGKGFDVSGQPSPEAKSEGWARRRNLAYWINVYFRMPYSEFVRLRADLEKNPGNYNMYQVTAMAYVQKAVKNERVMFDNLDRTEGKAVQKVQNEGGLELRIIKEVKKTKSKK
jgi:hypothetical protein